LVKRAFLADLNAEKEQEAKKQSETPVSTPDQIRQKVEAMEDEFSGMWKKLSDPPKQPDID
jgi:hypothetical protein